MRAGRFWFLAGLIVLMGCGPKAPPKPAGVPAEAAWVGDKTGGVFTVIGPKDREGWRVRIWDERSGALKDEGLFVLRMGYGRSDILPEDIARYDGRSLILKDGAQLTPKAR